jgi:hypothetical protein
MAEPHPLSKLSSGAPATIALALALSLAVLLLYCLTIVLARLPCILLLPVIALPAWPIWRYQTGRVLFERRAILASVATEASHLRQWFWAGRVTSVLQVFVALFLATMLFGFTTLLQPAHWVILAGDAILLALLFNPVKRWLAGQIREEHQGFITRHWPLTAINVAVVVTLLVALEFFLLDRPDTRALPWYEVAEQAFLQAQSGTACAATGALMGLSSAIDQTTWHAAMWLIPGLPDVVTKVLAWFLFLAWTVFGAFLFTRCLLGVMTLFEGWTSAQARASDVKPLSRAFLYTILVLAVPYLYATLRFADGGLSLRESLPGSSLAGRDPCANFAFDTATLQTTINEDVTRAQTEAQTIADQRIDSALDNAFGRAEQGVDHYLDWYFSLIGEYTRLGTAITGNVGQLMTDKLSQHLFDDTRFLSIIENASTSIESESLHRMTGVAELVGARIGDAVNASPCPVKSIDFASLGNLERDKLRVAVSATLGLGVGMLTARYLARKPVAAVAGRLAAKRTVRTAGQFLAKGATKRGASLLLSAAAGTAICSPAGPAAVLCGLVAGVVTWAGTDKAMIEIDEALFRDKMRAELLAGLAEQKATIGRELKARHRQWIEAYAAEIERTTARVFNPARDGV